MLITLSLFDFTANKFCRDFEPFVTSTEQFAKYFNGEEQSLLSDDYPEIVLCDTPGSSNSNSSLESPRLSELDHRKSSANKRPAMVLPEVDSPPTFVKRVNSGANEEKLLTDNEFQAMVAEKYLIREGMIDEPIHC